MVYFFFFQAEDGIRDWSVTGVQTCALPISNRERGGIRVGDDVLVPEPLLVGRNPAKLKEIAERHDLPRWTTDLDAALGDPDVSVYFDAQVTSAHVSALTAAIDAGK